MSANLYWECRETGVRWCVEPPLGKVKDCGGEKFASLWWHLLHKSGKLRHSSHKGLRDEQENAAVYRLTSLLTPRASSILGGRSFAPDVKEA
jgi:hypothetical protein